MRRISELSSSQVDELVRWFDGLWWINGRTRADVEVMLASCAVIAFVDDDDRLVAFARAISDRVYKALVLDVVVAVEQRGTGLGATLMDAVLAHPAVVTCAHIELYCAPDMVAFYERYGFTADLGTLTFMRATRE